MAEGSIRLMLGNEKYKGDALLQKTCTVDFLTKRRAENNGQVPQYYVEDSHPAIIDKETWEAVRLELERRRVYAEKHSIGKIDYATAKIPLAGKVICGKCGKAYGRKVWNSNNERLRRVVWLCSARYEIKGKKGCDSRHIDEWVLYLAFIDAFNIVVETRERYIRKWESDLSEGNVLKRVTAKRFIQIFSKAKPIDQLDINLYFKLVEKITVYNEGILVVSLFDGSEIEGEIE